MDLWLRQIGIGGFTYIIMRKFNIQKYLGDDNGHYDWHIDVDWLTSLQVQRKISMTVQLSNPDEYEGGDFRSEGRSVAA